MRERRTIEIKEIVANEHEEDSERRKTSLVGLNARQVDIRDHNETVEYDRKDAIVVRIQENVLAVGE